MGRHIHYLRTQPTHKQHLTAMDFVNKLTGGNSQGQGQGQTSSEQTQSTGSSGGQQQSSGGFLGGIGDKLNSAAGGGRESEKNEDYLDKGVDFVQEKFLGQGPQDNESA